MNLHDIPANPGRERLPAGERAPEDLWQSIVNEMNNLPPLPTNFLVHPSVDPSTITHEDLVRVRDRMRQQLWAVPRPVARFTDWYSPQEAELTFETRSAPRSVENLVNEVYQMLRTIEYAHPRAEMRERMCFGVTPREYYELQAAFDPRDPRSAIQMSHEDGTMRVMGIRVVPTR